MFRMTGRNNASPCRIYVASSECSWEADEPTSREQRDSVCIAWFRELQSGVHVLLEAMAPNSVDVIMVRTNIRKLYTALGKDLYSNSPHCERIASDIHDSLNHELKPGDAPPEQRGILLDINEHAMAECIKALDAESWRPSGELV